jgi:xylulokinase
MSAPAAGRAAPLLIGIDCGTGSIRALLADAHGRALACAARPTPAISVGPGMAEYDPEQLWQTTVAVLRELATHVPAGGEIAGVACASMGEAFVLVDASGAPLGRAITWFDRRTEPDAAWLAEHVGVERLFRITGLPLNATFSLCKLMWQRRADPALFARARRMLNLSGYIAFRLGGEAAVDYSLASRTLCLDISERRWSQGLLDAVGIDATLLPPLAACGTSLGRVRADVLAETGLPGRPVVGVGGHDHVCGAFAAGAVRPGVVLDSMGTAEALMQTVARPVLADMSESRGFWQGAVELDAPFAFVGAGINSSGGTIEWFRNLLGDAEHAVPARDALIGEAAKVPVGSLGVAFLPHLAYATAPVVDNESRGGFVGLTTHTSRGAMFRAVLEGLALEARLCVDAMAQLPGAGRAEEIRVIGGNTRNPLLLRIKAAAYGRPLTVIGEPEATALGAALLGGLAAGLWPDFATALGAIEQERRIVEPDPDWTACYETFFEAIYRRLYSTLAPISHELTRFGASKAE